jgi:hypothetical protein
VSLPDRGALSAKEDGPMARLILTSLVLAIFIHPLYAQSTQGGTQVGEKPHFVIAITA